jgi:hypothetical protein
VAHLSTQATADAVNARDRIGSGPWYNAKARLIARDLDELDTALTEKGAVVNGRGDTPNMTRYTDRLAARRQRVSAW